MKAGLRDRGQPGEGRQRVAEVRRIEALQPERQADVKDSGTRSPECTAKRFGGENGCACMFNQTLIPNVGSSGSDIL